MHKYGTLFAIETFARLLYTVGHRSGPTAKHSHSLHLKRAQGVRKNKDYTDDDIRWDVPAAASREISESLVDQNVSWLASQ